MIGRINAVIEHKTDADPPVITQERVDIIKADVQRNGSRKVDTARLTLPAGVRVKINDIVSYVQDEVSLEFLTGIWNFQGSYRDECGFRLDGKIKRSVDGATADWTERAADSNFVNPNTNAGNQNKFRGNFGATFSAAGQEIRVDDDSRLDFSEQFDIIIFFKNMQNTNLSTHFNGATNDKMILFAKHDGTDGVEIGLKKISSPNTWVVYAKLNSTEFEGDGTLIGYSTDVGQISHADDTKPRMIRFYRDNEDEVRLSLDGLMDGDDCQKTVASTQSSTRTTEPLYFGTNKAHVTNSPSGSEDNYDFKGHIFQIRVYSGAYLTDLDIEVLRTASAQPMTMKFSGTVWQRNEKLNSTVVELISQSKSLLEAQLNSSFFAQSAVTAKTDTETAAHNKNLFDENQYIWKIAQTMIYNLDPDFIFRKFGANNQAVSGQYLAVGGFIPNIELLQLNANQQFLTLPTKTFLYEYDEDTAGSNLDTGYTFDAKQCIMTERGEDDVKLINDIEIYGDLVKISEIDKSLGQVPSGSLPLVLPTKFTRPPLPPITLVRGTSSTPSTDRADIIRPRKYIINSETTECFITNLTAGSGNDLTTSDYVWAQEYWYEVTEDLIGSQGGTGDDVRHAIIKDDDSITKYGKHSARVYVPQLLKKGDFETFAQRYRDERKDEKRRYTITLPYLLNSLRENHRVTLRNELMKFPDSSGSTTTNEYVRSIRWQYPELKTTIEVGDHLYDAFDIIKNQTTVTSHLAVGGIATRVNTA